MKAIRGAAPIWRCLGAIILCFLLGNLCFQIILVNMDAQFGRFSDCASTILHGQAWLYAFQNRILPSAEIGGLSRLFSVDWLTATFVYYRLMLVINAMAFGLLCRPWERPYAETVYTLCVFHVCYMASLLAGYWLYAFDLQNQLWLTLLFAIFLSEMSGSIKAILLTGLAVAWQFTFEEVIYLPILYLIFWNLEDILDFRIASLLRRPANWALLGVICLSLTATHFTRALLIKGVVSVGSKHFLLGQTLMAGVNFQDLMREIGLVFWPGILRDNFWLQGPGIFLFFNVVAVLLVRPVWRKDAKATAIFGLFACMSLVTFLFAHLQETNTFIPMLLTLFVLFLRGRGRGHLLRQGAPPESGTE
jgi:uncharacterized membrane protein